jgi:hypothetical protein
MTTRSECGTCPETSVPRDRRVSGFSLKQLLKIVAAVVVAGILVYGEVWAIRQGPVLSGPDVLLIGGASRDTDEPLRETDGQIGLVHGSDMRQQTKEAA